MSLSTRPEVRSGVKRTLAIVVPAVVLVFALWAVAHEVRDMDPDSLGSALTSVGLPSVLASLTFALASYACLYVYDRIALRQLRIEIPSHDVAATAFLANAVAQTAGVAAFTGGAVRLRGYRRFGVSLAQVGQIVLINTVGFVLGTWAWLAVALALEPRAATPVLAGGAAVLQSVGIALAAAWLLMFYFVGTAGRTVRVFGHELWLPGRATTLMLTALSMLELALCAASFYSLLPFRAGPSFAGFVGLYLVGVVAGLISTVPAGVGVFEWAMLALLPGVPSSAVLAAALLYRITYYLAPLAIAVLITAVNRGTGWTRALSDRTYALRTRLRPVLARFIAVLVFVVGAFFMVTGSVSVPALHRNSVPAPLLESSHLGTSLVGLFMVFGARSLWARSRSAWLLAMVASVAVLPLAVLRGGVPSLLLWAITLVVAAFLWFARRSFDRAGGVLDEPWSLRWTVSLVAVVAATAWLIDFMHDQPSYDGVVFWQLARDAQAPRAARSLLVVIVVIGLLAMTRLLRGDRRPLPPSGLDQISRAMSVVDAQDDTEACLAMLGDKVLLFSEDGRGFVMMQRFGGSLIAMGDPVGPSDLAVDLIWQFREEADRRGLRPVFFQVGGEHWQTYLDLGLSLAKLGEEGIVNLTDFSLDGRPRKHLRQAMSRAVREGLSFRVMELPEVDERLGELSQISAQWLADKAGAEKGFSLGSFDPRYIASCPVAVIEREGRIVAFANLWTTSTRARLSIDLMRHLRDVPNGTMDFLFISLFCWGRDHGYASFSLGMAPLTGMAEHRLAGRWTRWASLFARYGERFYGFSGLRHFKDKFAPVWEPRYLAAPSGYGTVAALVDVTRLVSLEPVRGVAAEQATITPENTDQL